MTRNATLSSAIQYITDVFVQEDELLQRVRLAGESLRAGMQVSPLEGQLLLVLARLITAERILEIGSFVGYSTLWLARALPSHGQLITIEADDHHAQMAQGFFEQSECHSRITLLKGRALEQLPHLTNQRFDLVFIDAQKSEYLDYLQCVEPMIRVGGLIIGDNSLLFGAVHAEPQQRVSAAATHAMRAFNKHLSDTTFYDAILLPTSEGLTIARKK